MQISTLTQHIISVREQRKGTFIERKAKLDLWKGRLANLIGLEKEPKWKDIVKSVDSLDKWERLLDKAKELKDSIDTFTSETGDFSLAYSRATRDYVNIGAVGIYREGKSEFVANATQLKNDWIIPRQATNHACTTAPINIVNGPSKDGKQEIVRVYYYTVSQIVELFADYIEELGESSECITCKKIYTRDQLKEWCQSNENMSFQNSIAENKTELQKKFRLYLKKIDCYIERLVQSKDDVPYKDYEISEIVKGEVLAREYYSSVSYYQTPNDIDQHETYTSFATRKAQVFTTFGIGNEHNVTGIQFLDTPGIGEHKVGIEKLLRNAVSKDLDIIIGVRKIGPNTNNDQEQQMLLNVIRGSMATWKNAKEWIYFLLNAFPGATINHANTMRDGIIESLALPGVGGKSISVSKSHFIPIDLKNNKELTPNGYYDDNPIGRFLASILETFIPKIKTIDDGFYNLADAQYDAIAKAYVGLQNMINAINLPTYTNLTDQVKARLKSIGSAFIDKGMLDALAKIKTGLKDNISEFCGMGDESSDPLGAEVAKIFEVPCTDNSFDKLVEHIANKHRAKFEFEWDTNNEFLMYQELKRKLVKSMRESIHSKIDWESACTALQEAKELFCKILMNTGKLEGIVSSEQRVSSCDEWFDLFISLLKAEGGYNKLVEIFENLRNYSIDPVKVLDADIDDILRASSRHDKFDGKSFEEAEDAMYAFVSSLYNIELVTKQTTLKTLASDKVSKISASYNEVFSPAFNIVSSQGKYGHQAYDQFEDFYRNHSFLLADSEQEQKQGLVDTCKLICK